MLFLTLSLNFRCDKAIVFENCVLFGNTLSNLLSSLYTKFLKIWNVCYWMLSSFTLNFNLPPIASCECNEDVPWFFSLPLKCWQHLCTASQLHELLVQLDRTFCPNASKESSLPTVHRRASACRMVEEFLQIPSNVPKRAYHVLSCMEPFLN